MSDKRNRQAGNLSLKVEITTEMIEAGLPGLYAYSPEWSAEEALVEIYSAMERARRSRGRLDGARAGKGGNKGKRGPAIITN